MTNKTVGDADRKRWRELTKRFMLLAFKHGKKLVPTRDGYYKIIAQEGEKEWKLS